MWDVTTTDIDLEKVDFAAVARAYKIIYFYAAGKSRIIDLLFGAGEDGELEEWDNGDSEEIPPELRIRYESWFLDNMDRPEFRMAYLMIHGESRNRITFDSILNRMFRVPDEDRIPQEQLHEMYERLMERITVRESVAGNEKQRQEKTYDRYG